MTEPLHISKRDRLIIAGPIEVSLKGCQQSAQQHRIEDHIQYGTSLSHRIFADENPEIIWLFTDATEEEIKSIGLEPEIIDQWGVEIDEGCLPDSPEFKTIDECVTYLKGKVQPIWKSQLR